MRVIRGLAWDVAVDLRPDSPTYRQWCGLELSAETRRMVYIPRGFAHGYQTLADDTDVLYFVSAPYSPSTSAASGGTTRDWPSRGRFVRPRP